MKKSNLIISVLLVVASCQPKEKTTNISSIEPVETEVEANKEGEWIHLFDGKNFDNWKGYGLQQIPEGWTIEDGVMKFTPQKDGGKNIVTRDEFTNFVLSIEWKISENGNSGIFWAVVEDPAYKEAYETGPEIQVLDNAGHPDAEYPSHTAGALYDMVEPSEDATNPAGEWNLCLITVDYKNNIGSVDMNGVRIVDFDPRGEKWDAMIMNSKFADWPGFAKSQTGRIGLQDHGDVVYYRNIKIKKLPQ